MEVSAPWERVRWIGLVVMVMVVVGWVVLVMRVRGCGSVRGLDGGAGPTPAGCGAVLPAQATCVGATSLSWKRARGGADQGAGAK